MTVKGFDVIGLGVSTLDLVMVVDDFPQDEGVQRAQASALQGGGPVATAMVALARLGARTAMVDRVGDDWRGRLVVEEFEREGVSVECLQRAPNRSSSIASILVRKEDGARTIVYSPGDVEELSAADIPEGLIASAKILHLNGRHLDASMQSAIKAMKHGVLVSFDGGSHRFRKELVDLIKLTDICIVAREFASSFSAETDVHAAGRKLLQSGPGIVVITDGSDGSWIFKADGAHFHQPAFTFDSVVDTTGAGDAYHGAFLFGLTRGYNLQSCAILASAVAAINTQHLGGRGGLPSLEQAVAFLAERNVQL
jgi:sulfofructose kinase